MAAIPKATTRLPARRLSVAEEVVSCTRFPFPEAFGSKDRKHVQQRPAPCGKAGGKFGFGLALRILFWLATPDRGAAWNLAFQIGKPARETFGDWQAAFGYRYVESDAVVDGFTDSDFGGGGTNVQGFTLGGNMALSPAVRLGLKWMSSDEVTGPPLSTDILQFDINAKF